MSIELDSTDPGWNWGVSGMARAMQAGYRWPRLGLFFTAWWPRVSPYNCAELAVQPFLRWHTLGDGVVMLLAGVSLVVGRRILEAKFMALIGVRDYFQHEVLHSRMRALAAARDAHEGNLSPGIIVEPAEPTDTGYIGGDWR